MRHNVTKDKWEKPQARYRLNRAQKREILKWFQELRFPDGYAANLQRGVNFETMRNNGLKSHDYHIFIERLLPVMVRGYVPKNIWQVLAELSFFFRHLCAKERSSGDFFYGVSSSYAALQIRENLSTCLL
jgi:hypothetical protein